MRAFFFLCWAWAGLCLAANPTPPLTATPAETQPLPPIRIFFGHNSVGDNMLEGLQRALPTLRIVRSKDASSLVQPGLAHFSTDNNANPSQKIAVFEQWMNAGLAKVANLAFNKFCYMDFNAQTDVPALFKTYRASMQRLAAAYPKVQWLHVTVPLKGSWDVHGNKKREQFNQLLRETYGAKVFDLAKLESTRPNNSIERTPQGAPALVKAYSDDDGHLNLLGQQRVSQAFIPFLAEWAPPPAPPSPPKN
ncbi:MAG: SGNH/GDSL hydrolase family protein [Cystobacterineae bacterium]|nr:SGNH/GDSL hydrolase family protein [Cystobacterineae bacterium]